MAMHGRNRLIRRAQERDRQGRESRGGQDGQPPPHHLRLTAVAAGLEGACACGGWRMIAFDHDAGAVRRLRREYAEHARRATTPSRPGADG